MNGKSNMGSDISKSMTRCMQDAGDNYTGDS